MERATWVVRIPRHLDSDSSGNWTAIPRLTGQLNRVASGVLTVLDPVDEKKGLRVWFGSGCRVATSGSPPIRLGIHLQDGARGHLGAQF